MTKTVLILGAGASSDYGYPLWGPLKKQMIDLKIDDFLDDIEGLTDEERVSHEKAYEEFLNIQQKNDSYTLDRIVYEIDKPKTKHLAPTGHFLINIAGYILAKVEAQRIDAGWVTEFQKILIDHLIANRTTHNAQQNVFSDITVISLNYDRVFEHFISDQFYKKLIEDQRYIPENLPYSINLSRYTNLKIIKPHGYICSLKNNNNFERVGMNQSLRIDGNSTSGIRYPGNDSAITYGDKKLLERAYFLRMGRHMYVVDERNESDYHQANIALKSAESVFCLGMSPDGICQSSLFFQHGQKIYLTNKATEIPQIQLCKPGPIYESLGTETSRLNAIDFPDCFKRIALN